MLIVFPLSLLSFLKIIGIVKATFKRQQLKKTQFVFYNQIIMITLFLRLVLYKIYDRNYDLR